MTLPQDLHDMTPAQREEAVRFYTGLPLAELRRRQVIAESDTTSAYNQLQSAVDPAIRSRLDRGLRNGQTTSDMLAEAVGRKDCEIQVLHLCGGFAIARGES